MWESCLQYAHVKNSEELTNCEERQIICKLKVDVQVKGGCAHFTMCIFHFQLIDLDP